MSTIVKKIVIPPDHKINLDLEFPPESITGEVEMTIIIKPKGPALGKDGKPLNRMAELRGIYKGQVWMSDDFDAPLEDFKEYM